jgi:hypothetical protein
VGNPGFAGLCHQGYVLDKQRMENGAFLGEDYFERLLEETAIFVSANVASTRRLPTFMPPALTIMLTRQPHGHFSLKYRINSISPYMAAPLLS